GPMLIRDIGSSHVGASLRLPHPAAFYQSQPVSATPGVPPE
ncbi:MAG: hypothetical protein RJA99_1883, partial [Pseudomonadota bacterium]